MKYITLTILSILLFLTVHFSKAQTISDPVKNPGYQKPAGIEADSKALAQKENVIVEEKMNVEALMPEIRDHMNNHYKDYRIRRVIKRCDPKGKVTYEASLEKNDSSLRLVYNDQGQFLRESDNLTDVLYYILATAMSGKK